MGISPRQTMAIYLPPSYSDANRRFPVLYLLPNFKCDLWRYTGATFQGFRLKDAMDKQISSGAAKEMIVVLPNTTHFLGGSFYRNSPLTGNWEDYIVRDVVQYVDTHFRTIAAANARALAGHGVGGFGALELGLKHPELFSSVYGMSPAVFDPNGAEEFARLGKKAAASWPLLTEQWNKLDPVTRRRSFRDHVQKLLNSPSRQVFLQGLFISYGAAVSPQLSLPYPHIAFPAMGATSSSGDPLARCFADGLGGWDAKLDRYVAGKGRLHAITIEYGRDDEYDWIRHGAEYVSSLMRSKGIAIELAIHEGSHESKLGRRLETAMLPAISNSLRHD